jgi:hypothetical protein
MAKSTYHDVPRYAGPYTVKVWENKYKNSVHYGARGSLVVKKLDYKAEGRGFETRWGEILNLPNPSGHTRPWGLLSF